MISIVRRSVTLPSSGDVRRQAVAVPRAPSAVLATPRLVRRPRWPAQDRGIQYARSPLVTASVGDAAGEASPAGDASPAAGEEEKKGLSSLAQRAIFGTLLGLCAAVIIIIGSWPFAAVCCIAAYQCSQEFIGMVNAQGIAKGMKPPPPLVSSAISLLCVGLNAWSYMSGGKMASAMAVATLGVLSLQLFASEKPRFSQLTSSVFGLMYCGYLPSFWIKLRLLSIPAVNTVFLQNAQGILGGVTNATVGLVATWTAVLCIIAADTGAYFCGKTLGKTQLIKVSPKKTVEGAIGGLISSILGALLCYKMFQWPGSVLGAAAIGTIVFVSSIFGDLIESVIKRDAGLKDASNLIPGHGGLLDRLDSYLFTGACVYFFMRFFLVSFGV
jgi:phosphatidate cytidylyltransferase